MSLAGSHHKASVSEEMKGIRGLIEGNVEVVSPHPRVFDSRNATYRSEAALLSCFVLPNCPVVTLITS